MRDCLAGLGQLFEVLVRVAAIVWRGVTNYREDIGNETAFVVVLMTEIG